MTDCKPYFEWDLNTTSLLPSHWHSSVLKVIDEAGIPTLLSGQSAQSREQSSNYELPVIVVMGEACTQRLPWLASLYKNQLREFASKSHGIDLYPAKDLRSSININCLRGVGARYEAHVDTNTVTGVLFACDANADTGGELVFRAADGSQTVIWPRKGLFISFDGRALPHYVAPLMQVMDRISIPLNYYDHPSDQRRPTGLDDYLYSSVEKRP